MGTQGMFNWNLFQVCFLLLAFSFSGKESISASCFCVKRSWLVMIPSSLNYYYSLPSFWWILVVSGSRNYHQQVITLPLSFFSEASSSNRASSSHLTSSVPSCSKYPTLWGLRFSIVTCVWLIYSKKFLGLESRDTWDHMCKVKLAIKYLLYH